MHPRPLLLFIALLPTLAATSVEPMTTQPATQAARLFLTLPEILDRTPSALRPRPGSNWLTDTKPQFDAWLNKQTADMIVDQQIRFTGAVATKDPTVHDPRIEWLVHFSDSAHHLVRFGSPSSWQIELPVLHTDEASAKRWQATKIGTPLRLKGTIKSVSDTPTVASPGQIPLLAFNIALDNPQITPEN